MHRRSFFAILAALCVPTVSQAAPLPPRQFHRYDRPNDRWVRIEPQEIKAGDVLWTHDPGGEFNEVLLVNKSDYPNRQFFSSQRINPKTNQWESF